MSDPPIVPRLERVPSIYSREYAETRDQLMRDWELAFEKQAKKGR